MASWMAAATWLGGTRAALAQDSPPTVILVSLDGFRADYLDWYKPATLLRLAEEGVSAGYLESVFPSKTFPSHYSLATGRYPEHHGIVGNTMRDADLGHFSLGNREAVADGHWWDDAEPIWVTLDRAGIKSAMYFWPGSEAAIGGVRPAYYQPFSADSLWDVRVRWIMDALALPDEERPHLLSFYLENVDTAGHREGPRSDAVESAVADVDSYLGQLIVELEARGLLDEINLIITSDHGMAANSRDSVIVLDDYIDLDAVDVVDWDPVLMVSPADGDVDGLVAALDAIPHLAAYRREHMPERLHYREHDRISPVIAMADVGWRIASRQYLAEYPHRFDGGTHGYDPAHPSMHGIFVARGPAFRSGATVDGFASVHVYALLCTLFGVEPAEHDGDIGVVRHLLK